MTSTEEDRATSNPTASPGATVTDGEKDTKPALEAETDVAAPEDIEDGEQKEEVGVSNNDKNWVETHNGATEPSTLDGTVDAPPLPDEAPPLPAEAPPGATEQDDGWAPVWEESAQAFYFYNRFTGATQWTNPRVPDAIAASAQPGPPGVSAPVAPTSTSSPPPAAITGYNPAIHGDYDLNAWYAQPAASEEQIAGLGAVEGPADPNTAYAATAAFNRFTGRFQNSEITPENYNDENKSKRQMNAFFDVDAAANSHDGRSLKAERSGKKLTKMELKQFKEKRKAKKEEKRRAWLRD